MAYSSIGQKTIEINWRNLAAGMTTTPETEDGGFANGTVISNGESATIVNLTAQPGVLNFPTVPTDKSTSLTGDMIASCEAPSFTYTRLFVSTDAGQDGRFFHCDSDGDLTEVGAEDTTNNYIYGRTDMILFQDEAYITNSGDIVRWSSVGSSNTFNYAFYSFSDSFAPHPAIVYEDNAFYGDGNLLLRQSSAGGTPQTILTLPTNQVIIALGIDPGSGKMLISVADQYNVSGTQNAQARVLYYDGFSNKALKVVLVDAMITSFYNVGSTVFVFYGQRMGYWNGAGIQFLRQLNIDLDNTELVYKHHVTNINDILYLIEKNRILAYGEIVSGQGRVFWYALQNVIVTTPTDLQFLVNIGNNLLSYSYSTAKFFTFDISDVSGSNLMFTSRFYSLEYEFDRPVTFNQVIIDYVDDIPLDSAAPNGVGLITVFSDNSTSTDLPVVSVGTQVKTFYEATYPSIATRSFRLRYIPLVTAAIKRMTIFYSDKG